MPILVAMVLGIMAALPQDSMFPLAAVVGIFGLLVWTTIRRLDWVTLGFLCLVAFGTHYRVLYILQERLESLQHVRELSRTRNLAMRGTVQQVGTLDGDGIRYRMTVSQVTIQTPEGRIQLDGEFGVRASENEQDAHFVRLADLPPGSLIAWRGRFRPVEPRYNFHAPNPEAMALSRNNLGNIEVDWETVRILTRDGGSVWIPARWTASCRDAFTGFIDRTSPHGYSGRLRAFLFNDFSNLTRAEIQSLRDAGLFHLYAVSGSHFMAFGGLLVLVLRILMPTRWAFPVAAMVLLGYLAILDFQPAATRAWVMLACLGLSWVLRRESDGPSALILAAFLMLAYDPLLLTNRGFLLSFAGAFALIVSGPLVLHDSQILRSGRIRERLQFLAGRSLILAVFAGVFVLPLQLYFFQTYHLLAPVSNLLAGFLSGLALTGSLAALLLAWIPGFPVEWLVAFAEACLRGMSVVAELLTSREYLIYRPAAPPLWGVFGAYTLLLLGRYMIPVSTPEFIPKATARFFILAAATVLCLGLVCYLQEPSSRDLRITVLDVGQGDATILELPGGGTILVDGGNSASSYGVPVLQAEVRSLGKNRIPSIVATHGDSDHVGGLGPLLREFPIPVLHEGTPHSTATLLIKLRQLAVERSIPVVAVHTGTIIYDQAGCRVTVLHPGPPGSERVQADPARAGRNPDSVVLLVEYGLFSGLLMADAPSTVERDLVESQLVRPVTLLRLGHHGSRSSSSETFLDYVRPVLAVVSCGLGNSYGQPATAVQERLRDRNIPLARTDQDGALRIWTDGESWSLDHGRSAAPLLDRFGGE